MKVTKSAMKKLVQIAKRVVDKVDGTILFHANETHYIIQFSNKQIIAQKKWENKDGMTFSFRIQPKELEELIKVKGGDVTFSLDANILTVLEGEEGQQQAVRLVTEDVRDFETTTEPMLDSENFLTILKEVHTAFEESDFEITNYMVLSKSGSLATTRHRIHYDLFQENFSFKNIYLHGDTVAFLTKTLKGTVYHGLYANQFTIESDGYQYILNTKTKVYVPNIRNIKRGKSAYEVTVNTKEFQELLKAYKKKCRRIQISFDGNKMILDPRQEDFPVQTLPVIGLKGVPEKAVFNTEVLKGLLSAQQEEVTTILHQDYKSISGEDGYMWWSYKPNKVLMIAGITEPNYEKEFEESQKRKEERTKAKVIEIQA